MLSELTQGFRSYLNCIHTASAWMASRICGSDFSPTARAERGLSD